MVLVSLGVVAAVIVAVLLVLFTGPDQPPTSRRADRRGGDGPAAVLAPPRVGPAGRLRGAAIVETELAGPWRRLRSTVVLVVLLALLGSLLAGAVAGGLSLAARALARAVSE